MSQSNSKPRKPERPADAVLFWHQTGRWAKKIRGKLHYFGRGSYDDARIEYERQAEDLHAGRLPSDEPDGLTVYQLCAKFLTAKKTQRENGELTARSFTEYADTCQRILKAFGKTRLVGDLRPADFGKLRATLAKTWGPVRLKCEIIRCRVPFNWAEKMLLLDKPAAFGDAFETPSAKTLRVHRSKQGPKMFEADEIRRLLDAAGQPLRAMILLGINCAFGNSDVSRLPLDALDLDGGWVDFARPKTGVDRRTPLWPETVAALREWLAVRPAPTNPEHAGLAFFTRRRGAWIDSVSSLVHEFTKLMRKCGIGGHRGFYALRHTLQTAGDECGDYLAVRSIMGHTGGADIGNVYRERMIDARLLKVTDHVRTWLFAEPNGEGEQQPEAVQPKLRVVG